MKKSERRFGVRRGMEWLLAALLGCTAVPAHAADPVPLKDFAALQDFGPIHLSPDGTMLATTTPEADHDEVVVLHLSDRKVLAHLSLGPHRRAANLIWANPTRVVIGLAEQQGSLAAATRTGELIAINADGSDQAYLYGYRSAGGGGTGSHIAVAGNNRGSAAILRALDDEPESLVVQILDWEDGERTGHLTLAKLNVYSGIVKRIDSAPMTGFNGKFLVDAAGRPRYYAGTDLELQLHTFQKPAQGGDWQEMKSAATAKGARVIPLALSQDGSRVYLRSEEDTGRFCLIELTLADQTRRSLACDEEADVSDAVFSFDHQRPIAVEVDGNAPWQRLLDTDHPDRNRLAALQKSFPGQTIVPVSQSRDGSRVILRVQSDRNPGDYYLFEPKTMKASYIAASYSAIDPERMGERRGIRFKARDGQLLHGLLTLPTGVAPTSLPLVVIPHGGPFFVMDEWVWERDAQVLASRGYAVLQVNYRGSAGYGAAFEQSARRAWNTRMIDDVTDGTRWVVGQGFADSKRICVYGGSYGGYAALISAEREPSLYRCAVGYAGVYDLNGLRNDTDFSYSVTGRNYFRDYIGDDAAALTAASPISHVDQLQVPVLIVHGTQDERAPVSQARALRSALEDRKRPYEWMIRDNEGHGFVDPKNVEAFYATLLAFLDKNIGPAVSAADAAAPSPAPAAPN